MSTGLSADISILFACRLVFILIFVFILFVIYISTTDSVRLSNLVLLRIFTYFLICIIIYANMFICACISKHGTSIGTNLCISALVLIRVLVFI